MQFNNMMIFTFKSWPRLLLALLSLIVMGGARAQPTRTSEHAIAGVEALSGIDPTKSEYWETNTDTTGYHNDDDNKTFFLYNVGTGKFVNMGGAWGTHAALHTTPK